MSLDEKGVVKVVKRWGECVKCDKITEIKETPSGYEVCRSCWGEWLI